MRRNINNETIEGRVYDHNLKLKTVQKQGDNYGKPFIQGELFIATDDEGLNVIPIHYSYVAEKTKAGKANQTFTALKKIVEDEQTWLKVGKDNATMVSASTALDVNDFYPDPSKDELVSTKRNEGGFINFVQTLKPEEKDRATFMADMLIVNITEKEANEEKNIPAYVNVNGYIFNFRNEIKPVSLIVKNPNGMNYFMGLEVSNAEPIYTKVWGKINFKSTVETKTEQSAWGDSEAVSTSTRTHKEWIITGTAPIPYEYGDEKILTADDMNKASQDRELLLAKIKSDAIEYQKNRNISAETASGGFPTPSIMSNTATNSAPFRF